MTTGRLELITGLMKLGLTRSQAGKAVRSILGRIGERLAARDRVAIQGFGTFIFKENRRARMFDPRSGISRNIKGRTLLRFRASGEFVKALGRPRR